MKIYVFIYCIIFASCKREDKVYNLLTNNGTFKSWDYVKNGERSQNGMMFYKDSMYWFYYTFYNDSVSVYMHDAEYGYKNHWRYIKDSIYEWDRGNYLRMKIFYISEDSLVIDGAESKDKEHIYLVKSKLQEMPMDYEEYKEIYPRPPIKWEVFGLTPPDF